MMTGMAVAMAVRKERRSWLQATRERLKMVAKATGIAAGGVIVIKKLVIKHKPIVIDGEIRLVGG